MWTCPLKLQQHLEAVKKGTSFGAPCVLENKLAEMVIDAVPSIEMVDLLIVELKLAWLF